MNTVFKLFLSMSFSGAALILALLAGKRFWRDKISRQWQYYIWLVVILRLLLPFAPERNLMATACQAVEQALSGTTLSVLPQPMTDTEDADVPVSVWTPGSVTVDNALQEDENADNPAPDFKDAAHLSSGNENVGDYIWLVWLAVVSGLLIRKITMYQSFVRYVKDGCSPVNDIAMLERFSDAATQTGIKKPVELCVNPLVSSPMLIGFFHPCIVLPGTEISEKDFHYIALHELTHHKRRDILYKWLVQVTVCLHWFNPMVYRMRREITRACEFSCDAAVLAKVGKDHAPEYGKTLLDAMAAVRTYRENFGAVTLSENKQLLKERLVAVMNVRKKSKTVVMLTGVMTLCLIFGAAFMGVYPAAAAQPDSTKEHRSSPAEAGNAADNNGQTPIALQAEQYYEAGSFPMFLIAFSRMDEEAKGAWLNRIYADGQFMFLDAVASQLETDSAHIQQIAEKAYADDSVIFFSVVVKRMSEKTLKAWLDRAQADGKFAFQSILFDLLDDEKLDAMEEELEKQDETARKQEYLEHGIVSDQNLKTFYYESQLVHIFLDIRKEKSFYFLQVNPQGTVNVKVTRDENNHIESVDYMTDAEVTALFSDMKEEENDEYEASAYDMPQIISVNEQRIAAGAKRWFGDYDLRSGDKIRYDIEAETGDAIMVGFVNNADGRFSDTTYCFALVHREDGVLKCTADFVCGEPVKDGQYKLYIYAPEGALGNVKGSVSIAHAQ